MKVTFKSFTNNGDTYESANCKEGYYCTGFGRLHNGNNFLYTGMMPVNGKFINFPEPMHFFTFGGYNE